MPQRKWWRGPPVAFMMTQDEASPGTFPPLRPGTGYESSHTRRDSDMDTQNNRDDCSRRTFVKSAAAVTGALSHVISGPFIHASDKVGGKPPIVGEGAFRYECQHDWGQLPDHIHWFETHGVAIDKSGFVYINHRAGGDKPSSAAVAQDTIVVFDRDGKFVRSFGKEYHGGGHGIDIREERGQEFLYLSCMMPVNLVLKTDLKGEVVWKKDRKDLAASHKYDDATARFSPTNIAFAPLGGFYIADGYGSNYIHQYDPEANWVRTWGGTGEELGRFKTPHGIWLDDRPGHEPSLVVADRANARLQYFTLDGKPIKVVNGVSFPAHFDIRGDVLLVPDLHARVTLMDKDNQVITHLGYNAEWTKKVLDGFKVRSRPESWEPGRFVHPHDACFDHDGNIFVAEWVATGRISKLKKV